METILKSVYNKITIREIINKKEECNCQLVALNRKGEAECTWCHRIVNPYGTPHKINKDVQP